MKTFAEKIKEARLERGMYQDEFSKLLGVSRRMLVDYESGDSRPYRKRVAAFAKILELPAEYLANDNCNTVLEALNKPSQEALEEEERQRKLKEKQAISEMKFLLERSNALLAGGELPEKYKEAFFESMYEAYMKGKNNP